MSPLPRLPLLPDPLRRIHVSRDLGAITTAGAEEDPEKVGMNRRTIERIWSSARDLYRSGVHPAVQLCLRRHGRVVLDRSIGHALDVYCLFAPPDMNRALETARRALGSFSQWEILFHPGADCPGEFLTHISRRGHVLGERRKIKR